MYIQISKIRTVETKGERRETNKDCDADDDDR